MKIIKILEYMKYLKTRNKFLEKHIEKMQEDIEYYINKDIVKNKEIQKLKEEIKKREKLYLFVNNNQYIIKKEIINSFYWIADETKYDIIINTKRGVI